MRRTGVQPSAVCEVSGARLTDGAEPEPSRRHERLPPRRDRRGRLQRHLGRGGGRRQRRRHRRPDRRGPPRLRRTPARATWSSARTPASRRASISRRSTASNGFRLDGIDADDCSGSSVAGAGDVNGDGIDDLIIGAPAPTRTASTTPARATSSSARTPASRRASISRRSTASNGFRLDGIDAYDCSGISVAGAGDVNGDGIDDLIVGAPGADPDGKYDAGESYVVFGTDTGFAASLDLSALDGSNGFRLDGIDADDRSGCSVAGAGDVNGDGIDDLIVGAPGADPDGDAAGESYVVFGTDTGFAASLDLSALDGSNGFRLDGIDAYDRSGSSVAGAGDVNGDGIDDLIVGAPGPTRTASLRRRELRRLRHRRRLRGEPRSLGARRHRTASASTGSTRTTAAAPRSPGRATSTATASTT